jgi:glycosyltransferase involved in cell wall biosynthesis
MNAFDTRWIGPHGIGRFAAELYRRLEGFSAIQIGGHPASPWDPLALTRYLYSARPQLFFSPGYNAPLWSPCPFVFCIHDLNHLYIPENSSSLKRLYYARILRPAIDRARVVLTVSEFSRRSICEWAAVDASRIVNVGNGVSEAFQPDGPRFTAERPYLLHVGSHRPHKNFSRVLQAFAASGLSAEFMLVSTGTCSPDLRHEIESLQLTPDVLFVGNAADDELGALYRGALALTFVSLYEGFGLPIVEAMACGTPVISSTAASMPEIAGDAAVLVNPHDVQAISAAMKEMAANATLRHSLRERGLNRARLYTWEATARKVTAALSQCVSR